MNCDLHFVNSFLNFVNRERVCFPGDEIKVTIEVNVKQLTKIDEIHLNIIGTAKNKFMKQMPVGSKLISGTTDLIHKKIEVLKDANLPSGQHKFRSSFTLPKNLPSSFKFRNNATSKLTRWKKTGCAIKYFVQIVVVRANNPNKKFDFPFEVIAPLDLNEIVPSLRKPRETRTDELNQISKDFTMFASVPKRGFVPGENINVFVSVTNNSEFHVREIEILLIKKIILRSLPSKETLEREEEEWIIPEAHVDCEEIPAGESRDFQKIIKVPQLTPNIDSVDLLQVCYRIWVRAKTNSENRRETLVIPITIGTVALKNENNKTESDEISAKKGNLTLQLNTNVEHDSTICTCTCVCSHCSKVRVYSERYEDYSPLSLDTPGEQPMTPMSPIGSFEDKRPIFMSFETQTTQTVTNVQATIE